MGPARLVIGCKVDRDLCTWRRRGGDENVLRRLEVRKATIRRIHRDVDQGRRTAAEIGGDVAREVARLGKDRDRLSRRQIWRKVIELLDSRHSKQRGGGRIGGAPPGGGAGGGHKPPETR